MRIALNQWVRNNSTILLNTGSLIGTMLVTSLLGFIYTWVAARYFSQDAVGLASAANSSMTLLSSFGLMGLGTLLISELPRNKGKEGALLSAGLLVSCGASGILAILFALCTPLISPDLQSLGANIQNISLFSLGVIITSITTILDQALVGLLKGALQFWRNALFSVAKLIILFMVSFSIANATGVTIYTSWTVGGIISLLPLAGLAIWKVKQTGISPWPQWGWIRKLGPAAIQHHILNVILLTPMRILPVLVTILLSAKLNAPFYASLMIANFVYAFSSSLTVVLHATNAADHTALAQKARMTIGLSVISSLVAALFLLPFSDLVLTFFGKNYALEGLWSLRILTLGAFPLIIKNHYISICRIKDQMQRAIIPITAGSILELTLASVGAHYGSLSGLSLGWIIGMCIEAVFMLPVILKTTLYHKTSDSTQESAHMPIERDWAIFNTSHSGQLELDPALSVMLIDTPTSPSISIVMVGTPTVKIPAIKRSKSFSALDDVSDQPTLKHPGIADGGVGSGRDNAALNIPTVRLPRIKPGKFVTQLDDDDFLNAPTVKRPRVTPASTSDPASKTAHDSKNQKEESFPSSEQNKLEN